MNREPLLSGAATTLAAGLVIGTIGWLGAMADNGDILPPSGFGWLEVIGFVLVIPAAIILKSQTRHG